MNCWGLPTLLVNSYRGHERLRFHTVYLTLPASRLNGNNLFQKLQNLVPTPA